MIKYDAPSITSLRVIKLGANFIQLRWDDVGSNFFYIIESTTVGEEGQEYGWVQVDYGSEPTWFGSNLIPNTKYKFRIATTHRKMNQSEYVYSEVIETFSENAYTITTMSNFIPSYDFIQKKLVKNQFDYIDFNNDKIQASLMNENFVYDPGIANITNVENYIASDDEYHEILGSVEKICGDINRIYLGVTDRVVYAFERYQNYAKVSNDGGQNWYYYQAVNDRVGYPIGENVMYQNENTSFLLGYDYAFYGRKVDEIRFSSDIHWWSDDQLTFVKLDVGSSIPFKTMIFGNFARYPDDIRRKVEAQCANNRWLYAVAENNVRRILIKGAPVDSEGKIQWDETVYKICDNDNIVVKKMDILNGVCYALVTGEVKEAGLDRRNPDNIIDSEYRGIYRFDEFYVPEVFTLGDYTADGYENGVNVADKKVTFFPNGTHVGKVSSSWETRVFKGKTHGTLMSVKSTIFDNKDSFVFSADIYEEDGTTVNEEKLAKFKEDFEYPAVFDLYIENGEYVKPSVPNGGEWVRVYGNTEYERSLIEHKYSNMSVDGTSLFVNGANYTYKDVIDDPETVEKYDSVDVAKKYKSDYSFLSKKKVYLYQVRTEDGETFKFEPARYYNEAAFHYMHLTGERVWKNHENKVVLVTPEMKYQYTTDIDRLVNKEVWDRGEVTFYLEDVHFNKFSKYCNGILIHKRYDRESGFGGEIVGYYEYPYRVRDAASIIWKPENVVLSASLINQTREIVEEKEISTGMVDPDISPLMSVMGPEAYLNDSNFSKFCEYYLKFLSEGTESYYGKLLNFVKNKYPREKESFTYLWSEMRRRNIYLDEKKRDEVVRFFESKATNFYSSKGTADSYKFLFKLLYNADVEIEVESSVGIDYDIFVKSTNINQDLVGRTIYTKTGRANVTYIEKQFVDGQLRWKVTIHNLVGKFIEGQNIRSETTAFEGLITRGVKGKELAYSDIDYINRSRSYYVMRIKSELNTARYRDDVLRFVHPVGFGFIGVTLLTVFINSGISMRHVETMLNLNKAFRFDAGLPAKTPKFKTQIDPDSSPSDPLPLFNRLTGELVEVELPQTDFDINAWNTAINESTGEVFEVRDYEADEGDMIVDGVTYTASERRTNMSPLFSDFSNRFTDFRLLVENRLKDDIKNPRDVSKLVDKKEPTQINIGE